MGYIIMVPSLLGHSGCYVNLFSGNLTPTSRNANNVEPYIFETLFSGKSDTLPTALEWPLSLAIYVDILIVILLYDIYCTVLEKLIYRTIAYLATVAGCVATTMYSGCGSLATVLTDNMYDVDVADF